MEYLQIVQQLTFLVVLVAVGILVYLRVAQIRNNILLGKATDRNDRKEERLKAMLLIAFGQKKMFDRPIVGAMHFVIYGGFLLINIEVLEIVLDGLFGTHRLFAPYLGILYKLLVGFFEFLAFGVLAVCVVFLLRRNFIKLNRFQSPELKGFPALDANIILISEIFLMCALFTMNAADSALQLKTAGNEYLAAHYLPVGNFLISGLLTPIFKGFSAGELFAIERFAWWIHIIGILGFAIYVTYSKHLHIALAFPNTYYSNLEPKGKFESMPEITKEVKSMMGLEVAETTEEPAPIGRFGAKDVRDLTWKNLMEAYTCTECGRCTSQCPANLTGKTLSPRKIMMDTRDRLEELSENISIYGKDHDDGKSLYGDYISKEEVMACTTCNACVEACPVNISPLDIILQMRRYVVMEEADTPASWNSMFANTENNFAPWAFSPSDRFNWAEELKEKE